MSFIRFKCLNCEGEMENWCALGNHTMRQHGVKPKVLCICNKYLHTRAAINRHIAKHDTNAQISCMKCGKICLSQKYLRAHALSHSMDEQSHHSCDQCGKTFLHIAHLKAHKKTHLPDHEKYIFTCRTCNKSFTAKSVLKNHILTLHAERRLYICDICGCSFAQKGNMTYHIKSHGENYEYSCNVCSKSFKNKSKLTRHMETHGKAGHPCSVCSKLLKSRRTLQMHMLTHRKNTFTCHLCNKKYINQISLQVYDYFEKYTFMCDWYDEEAGQIRDLCLNFFPYDNSVQILDIGRGKKFVNRAQYPPLKIEMLQIGSTIRVFSRLLYIKNCSHATRCKLFDNFMSTFALIKPVPEKDYGKIITFILENGFQIVQLKKVKVDKDFAILMYKKKKKIIIIEYIISGEVVGMELMASDAIKKWRIAIGYKDPKLAAPGTLRNLYGESIIKNIVHGADSTTEVEEVNEIIIIIRTLTKQLNTNYQI